MILWGDVVMLNPFIGWGISTLLLWLLNRHNGSDNDTSSTQASPYTDSNSNQIGQAIPVIFGRVMIKNPLVSYYGSFRADIYTEEYGMHSGLDLASFWLPLLLMLINAITTEDTVVINGGTATEMPTGAAAAGSPSPLGGTDPTPGTGTVTTLQGQSVQAGPYRGVTTAPGMAQGKITYKNTGTKRAAIVNVIVYILMWLLMQLFNNHLGRTTIQKGFKYYLGWQHILCWTDKNIGIKKLWMNVYDSDVEQSTETGVWDNNNHIAYKKDNPAGISAYIEDDDMFGGVDEQGGFIGEIRFYFGTEDQDKDAWMIKEMQNTEIPKDLRGLTPRYPMFVTCVISDKNKEDGAYIGKQANIPEMWFELVNYPDNLYQEYKDDLFGLYSKRVGELVDDILAYMSNQDSTVQNYMKGYTDALVEAKAEYDTYYKDEQLKLKDVDAARDRLEEAERSGNTSVINDAKNAYDKAKDEADKAHQKTEQTFTDLRNAADDIKNNYPQTNRDEVASLVDKLDKLLDSGVWHLGKLDEDVNPAEVIYSILTNNLWGCNYDRITDIDSASLLQLGVTCEEEGLGVSALITSEAQAGQYIQKILNHINGIMYDDPYTGKLKFKLIRGDYDPNSLVVFDPSNCADMKFSRLDWSETSSATSVNFTFAANKYEDGQLLYNDVANRFITKSYKESSVEGMYFTKAINASWLAQVSQLASGYPLSTVEFTTNRVGHDIGLGDVIMITWLPYGIKEQVFRVTDIDYATLTSNAIKISAIEDIYGFATTKYAYAEVPEWKDPKKYASSIQYYMYLELPYEMTRSLDTKMNAYAARPTTDDIYYVNWRYTGTEYARRSRTNRWSMVAQLVYGTQEMYDDDSVGFEIEIIGAEARQMFDDKCQAIEDYPSVYTNRSVKNLVYIDGELLSYDKIIKLQNGHYSLTGVIHGVFDTLPRDHSAYSKVYFLDYGLSTNDSQVIATEGNFADEQLELRSGTQDDEEAFNISDIYNYHTTRRSEQPSPMANLKFGAERGTETKYEYNYPAGTIFGYDINFTFNLRNKFNQSQNIDVHSAVGDALPENTTQYYIKCSCNGKEFEFKYDAVENYGTASVNYPKDITLYWNEFCEKMGNRLQRVSDVQLEIGTYNNDKELYSYDHYDKHIIYHVPRVVGIIYPNPGDNVDQMAKDYADTIVTATHVEVPASQYTDFNTMTFEDAPLILVASATTTGLDGITGQDGIRYIPSTKAYRVDGANGNNDAIIHEIELKPEFVLQNDFVRNEGVNRRYYRYRNGQWLETDLYGNT